MGNWRCSGMAYSLSFVGLLFGVLILSNSSQIGSTLLFLTQTSDQASPCLLVAVERVSTM